MDGSCASERTDGVRFPGGTQTVDQDQQYAGTIESGVQAAYLSGSGLSKPKVEFEACQRYLDGDQ